MCKMRDKHGIVPISVCNDQDELKNRIKTWVSTHLLLLLNPASNGAIILQKQGQVHTRPLPRMLYYRRMINKIHRPLIILGISIILVLFSTGISYTTKLSGLNTNTGASLFFQTTPTPLVEVDRSVVGSTDGIVLMGGVIVLIVLIPILIQRKYWSETE